MLSLLIGFILGFSELLYANEVQPSPRFDLDDQTALTESTDDSNEDMNYKKQRRGKRIGEKETQGTEALNRFESNTVLKSKYMLNGVPLEVDPD